MRRQHKQALLAALLLLSQSTQAQKLSAPKISGFLNARYAWDSGSDSEHGFDIRRVRLAASGNITDRLDYKVQAEYETSVKIIDAYARWKIAKPFSVQFGEFKVPYSLETLYGPTSWLTIENPTAVAKLNGYQDLSGLKVNGRDIGVLVYGDLFPARSGDFSYVQYKVGVFNGNGINTKDNNNKKDVSALLYLHPVRQLTLSAGHYQGYYGPRGEEIARNRTSAGIEYKDSHLTLRSEYLHGKTGQQKSDGVYAVAGYKITPSVQPVISYDFFRPDTGAEERQSNYQIGINILPVKHVRLQAAYTYKAYRVASDVHQLEVQGFVEF